VSRCAKSTKFTVLCPTRLRDQRIIVEHTRKDLIDPAKTICTQGSPHLHVPQSLMDASAGVMNYLSDLTINASLKSVAEAGAGRQWHQDRHQQQLEKAITSSLSSYGNPTSCSEALEISGSPPWHLAHTSIRLVERRRYRNLRHAIWRATCKRGNLPYWPIHEPTTRALKDTKNPTGSTRLQDSSL
jgi:hypothetical protein